MSRVFGGAVLLPGETGEGLHASFEMDAGLIRLIAGDDEIGTWRREDCDVSPSGGGSFGMDLGDEAEAETPKHDYDAAIDEVIARVTPLRDPNEDDDILSKPMLVGIVGVSTFLMAGLTAATMML